VSKVKTKSVDAKRVAGIIVGVIASGFLCMHALLLGEKTT
jgi:hypothetical protein